MPRTIEHIVETHRVARARQAAGLPVWDRRIRLGDIFHAEHLSFEQRRDKIVRRLRSSSWLTDRGEFDPLTEVIDGLANADDTEEFDGWWDELYDYADNERVWIETH